MTPPNQPKRLQEQLYLIPESLIDAGANAIDNMFKMGGLDQDRVDELNVALESFRYASNHPAPTPTPTSAEAVLDSLIEDSGYLPSSEDSKHIVWVALRDVQQMIDDKKTELRQQQERSP